VIQALRRRWPIVLVMTALGAGLAAAVQQTTASTYTATATVAFESTNLSQVAGAPPSSAGEQERELNTEALTVRSPEVAGAVAQALGSSARPGALAAHISTAAVPSANVLRITASSAHAEESARLANAFAEQFIAVRAHTELARIESAQKQLVEELAAQPPGSAERASLRASVQRLNALRPFAGGGSRMIALAAVPARPTGLALVPAIAIGAAGGLLLSLLIVLLLESLDRRVKTLDEVEREYGLPALAVVPQFAFNSASAAQRKELLEPQRILRTAIEFAAVTRELDTILVTSAAVGEGKTTVAVDLAHAVALTGRSVVLVELDLRHPTFASQFDVNAREGLTLALTRGSSVQDQLVAPFPELPNLSVLFSGPLPPNPAELIASPKIAELIGALAWERDMVIIDSAPLNPVADAQILLDNPAIHAVLMVARAGRAKREEVLRARAILDRHAAEPLGLVVTGVRDAGRYGYDSYYASQPASATTHEQSEGSAAERRGLGKAEAPRGSGKAAEQV
jgi:capsular exopolysaccharide synthesis family protein